jgi:hypothetical protein
MSIHELASVVTPPASPTEIGGVASWIQVEREFGLSFPKDYYELVTCYGSGKFLPGHLEVLNPFSSTYKAKIDVELEVVGEDVQFEGIAGIGDPCRVFQAHPQRPGLFPWGRDAQGYHHFWFTDGKPEEWEIITIIPRDGLYSECKLSLTAFLVKNFQNEIQFMGSEPFPDDVTFAPR